MHLSRYSGHHQAEGLDWRQFRWPVLVAKFVSSGDIQRTYAIHEKTLRSWADS